jgi:formiminoglutamate deiminase
VGDNPYDESIATDLTAPTTPHQTWHAPLAWLGGDELSSDVVIEARDGVIASVSQGSPSPAATRLRGIVLPGLVNTHSHAFHRLLRGKTHRLGGDFWLWRERMYRAAASLTPDYCEEVATAVYVEMAMAGITTVGEFHYLHHQTEGVPYEDANEMGHAVIRAARAAGIRICLLDAGYFTAGLGGRALDPVQRRFADESPDHWLDRVDALRHAFEGADDVVIGLAPHSVRAVPRAGLERVADRRPPDAPVHIHVSEQPAENQECLESTGLSPTGLLDATGVLSAHTTLVHATHVSDEDIALIERSGSSVCLCPTTERDLGDGVGRAPELVAAGALLCIGSDSHAVIDPFEEIRGIEMHARLATGRRGVVAPARLLAAGTVDGAAALGVPSGGLAVGQPADLVVVDPDSPRLAGIEPETALDMVVFAATAADVTDVFVAGRPVVFDRVHPSWETAKTVLEPVRGLAI